MQQTFELKLPPELEGSTDAAGNFKSAMSYYLRPAMEAVTQAAASASKYPFLGEGYGIEEELTGGGVQYAIRNTHPLFRILEGGTRPHIIRAVNGPYLVFEFMGHLVQVPEVNHPGTQGEHALRDAWGRAFPQLVELGRQAFYRWTLAYGSWGGGA